MKCKCPDWKQNIDKLNSGFVMSFTHGLGGYQGKIMKYCPWCGKRLVKGNEENKGQSL